MNIKLILHKTMPGMHKSWVSGCRCEVSFNGLLGLSLQYLHQNFCAVTADFVSCKVNTQNEFHGIDAILHF